MTLEVGSQIETGDRHTPADPQAFGSLATRLTGALGRARQALQSHDLVLPGGTLAALDTLLAEFERRRVRIAIYGEVKAGKSTLLNAIAGAALSPVAFEPLTSIPVRVTYGEQTTWRVGDRQCADVAEIERCMRNGAGASEVLVETDLDLLELGGQVDLLDTPGLGSAEQLDAVSAAALRSLDAVVLVVRYPALFTQFTRCLMESLETDIGKLFVVWNLDADCAELLPEERTRHAETLRANVAGVHELFLVNARAGFQAMQADDAAGSVASGLTALIASLRRFAGSGGREVAALRQAAKRTQQLIDAAQQSLTARHELLAAALVEARARLQAAQAAADAEAGSARGRLADFEAAIARIGRQAAATATKLAEELRRHLRTARRAWTRRGDYPALESALATALSRYADSVAAANQATLESLQAEAGTFGTVAAASARERTEPIVGQLAPADRVRRATNGRGQLLRRALWHRWYLPGLAAFERTGITADLNSQAAWLRATSQTASNAASATLDSRLQEIARRADAEMEQIRSETNIMANQAEFERLSQDLPVVSAERESLQQITSEARALL